MMNQQELTHTWDEPELIAQENVSLIWPLVGPRLYAAFEKLQFIEYTPQDIFELLSKGQAQLWIGGDGEMIAITRIVTYPDVKRLCVDFIEGHDHKKYREHMEYIERWAVGLGATQAETEVRPGLERTARQEGWKRARVKMFKHLKQGIH